MAGRSYARALSADDVEVLAPIDRAYAERYGLEPVATPGSLSFYARSGHAFVAVREDEVTGFVLAHAVWDGFRPVVQASRVAVADSEDAASRAALLAALTKSAYDAAVYDLLILQPGRDEAGKRALLEQRYQPSDTAVFRRALGSRGNPGG